MARKNGTLQLELCDFLWPSEAHFLIDFSYKRCVQEMNVYVSDR